MREEFTSFHEDKFVRKEAASTAILPVSGLWSQQTSSGPPLGRSPPSSLSPPSLADSRLRPAIKAAASGSKHVEEAEGKGRRTSGGEGGQRPLQRRVCMHARQRGGLFRYILIFLYVNTTTLLAFSKSVASIPEQRRARIIKEGGRRERGSGSLTKDERRKTASEVNNARNSLSPAAA